MYRCHKARWSMTGRQDVGHCCCSGRIPLGRRWADTSSISGSMSHWSLSLTSSWGNQEMGAGGWEEHAKGREVKGEAGKDKRRRKRMKDSLFFFFKFRKLFRHKWLHLFGVLRKGDNKSGDGEEYPVQHACLIDCHYILAPKGILSSEMARWLIVLSQWNEPTVN